MATDHILDELDETEQQDFPDEEVGEAMTDQDVIRVIQAYRLEAEEAKKSRDQLDQDNQAAFLGLAPWTDRPEGQSSEFLPKNALAIEQITAFVERSLVSDSEWFSVTQGKQQPHTLQDHEIVAIMRCYLEQIAPPHAYQPRDMATLVADGIKVGLNRALIIFKVHGTRVTHRVFEAKPVDETTLEVSPDGALISPIPRRSMTLSMKLVTHWEPRIELVNPRDFFPDPTGRGLYEIHRIEKDLHDVLSNPLYTDEGKAQLRAMSGSMTLPDEGQRALEQNQDTTTPPFVRKTAVLDEFWGTILNDQGEVAYEKCLAVLANDKILLRPPEPYPFWHQESPFVVSPLIRVPFSVWHKALFDHATHLNIALSEMFNLMLDGGMSSVHGIKQLYPGMLENPASVSKGIAPGQTLIVKDEYIGQQVKVLEKIVQGEIPGDSFNMYTLLNAEHQASTLMNDLRLGLLPAKAVKATEVIQAQESSATMTDGISKMIEGNLIRLALRKLWMLLLQFADDLNADDLMAAVGEETAGRFLALSAAERFVQFAGHCSFEVKGLSATLGQTREFQKLAALLQLVTSNPLLEQVATQTFSFPEILKAAIRTLNINPQSVLASPQDQLQAQQALQQAERLKALGGNGTAARGGAGVSAQQVGEPQLPAEINQMTNPMTGMV